MSSISALNQQLTVIDKELEDFEVKNRRYIRLEKLINNSEYVAGCLAFIIVVIVGIIIGKTFGKNISEGIGVLMFYVGIFVISLLYEWLKSLFKYLLHLNFKISSQDLTTFDNKRSEFSRRRYKIQDEIKGEIRKVNEQKEREFIVHLNDAVNTIEKRKISLPDAGELISKLRATYNEIKKNGPYLHTFKYYDNRFDKLRHELNHYLDPKPQNTNPTGRSFIDLKTFTITTEGLEQPKKEEPKFIIPKPTETSKQLTPPAQVTKLTETPKPVVTPVQQIKPVEPPKQKTQQEIELENKQELSLLRKLQLLGILAEARLKQRLYDFSLMLMTKQCPPKATDYIHRLLKEEIDSLNERDCQIHNRSYYVEKFEEIQALIGIKQAPQAVIPIEAKEMIYENKSVAETFKDFKATYIKKEAGAKAIRITPKQDFEELNRHKHDVGFLGEEYIFEQEKKKLKKANREDLIPFVEWVSKESDAWGYDIRSYSEKGELMFIEVKTTTSGKASTFYLSETELNQMNVLDNYYIYRVYDFSIEERQGSVFPVSKDELPLYFNLEPLSYKVKPKSS